MSYPADAANTNTFTNVIPQLLAQGLLALRQMAVMPRYVNRAYETTAGEKGSSIDVPIPSAISATDVTPSFIPPNDAASSPTNVNIPLSNWKEAAFFLNDKEMLEVISGTIPMQASEAVKALANAVDNSILALYTGVYGWAGTAGTTPFATDLSAFVDARKALTNQLAPMDPRYVAIDADAEANALLLRAFQDASFRGDTDGIENGQIGKKLGSLWFVDQNMPYHTSGAYNSTSTVTGTEAIGQTTIAVSGGANGAFVVGDIVYFGTGLPSVPTYTVVSQVGDATPSSIVVSPAISVQVEASAVIYKKASHRVNLAFHRDAFALASRPFSGSDPMGLGNFQSAVDPVSGLTLRLEVCRQFKRTRFAFDILYGVKLVRKEFACRLAG